MRNRLVMLSFVLILWMAWPRRPATLRIVIGSPRVSIGTVLVVMSSSMRPLPILS